MLEKINNTKSFHLLPLLVMLHITMGMPLAHPLAHTHSGHDESAPVDNEHRFQNPADQGETHRCPICDFQATNQLHAVVNNVAHTEHHYTDGVVTATTSFSPKAASQHFDARAPPTFPAVFH